MRKFSYEPLIQGIIRRSFNGFFPSFKAEIERTQVFDNFLITPKSLKSIFLMDIINLMALLDLARLNNVASQLRH